jgi:hypothetical protein
MASEAHFHTSEGGTLAEFFANEYEKRVWHMHHDGRPVSQIAEELGEPPHFIRSIIVGIWHAEKVGKR